MQTDRDLDPLRDREDFRELLAGYVERNRDRLINLEIVRRDFLYARMVGINEYRGALAAADSSLRPRRYSIVPTR